MNYKKGFTLIEIIIVAGLTTVIGAILVGVLVNNSSMYYQESSTVASGIGLNDIVDEVNTDIKLAAGVTSIYEVPPLTFTSGQQTLILKLPATNDSGNLSEVFDYLVIFVDATNPKILRKQVFPDASSTRKAENKVLTTILENIEFGFLDKNGNTVSPADASSINTTVKLLSKSGSVGTSKSATIVTTLRNMQ